MNNNYAARPGTSPRPGSVEHKTYGTPEPPSSSARPRSRLSLTSRRGKDGSCDGVGDGGGGALWSGGAVVTGGGTVGSDDNNNNQRPGDGRRLDFTFTPPGVSLERSRTSNFTSTPRFGPHFRHHPETTAIIAHIPAYSSPSSDDSSSPDSHQPPVKKKYKVPARGDDDDDDSDGDGDGDDTIPSAADVREADELARMFRVSARTKNLDDDDDDIVDDS